MSESTEKVIISKDIENNETKIDYKSIKDIILSANDINILREVCIELFNNSCKLECDYLDEKIKEETLKKKIIELKLENIELQKENKNLKLKNKFLQKENEKLKQLKTFKTNRKSKETHKVDISKTSDSTIIKNEMTNNISTIQDDIKTNILNKTLDCQVINEQDMPVFINDDTDYSSEHKTSTTKDLDNAYNELKEETETEKKPLLESF